MLKESAEVIVALNLTPEELNEKIKGVDALIVRSATKVTRAVFEAANGGLKVVGRAGVGVDNVDLGAATEYGCLVVNAPTANTVAAAEHGIALMCSLARNVSQADASMRAGKWERSKYVGVSLVDKTLAVMGFGKVRCGVSAGGDGLRFGRLWGRGQGASASPRFVPALTPPSAAARSPWPPHSPSPLPPSPPRRSAARWRAAPRAWAWW